MQIADVFVHVLREICLSLRCFTCVDVCIFLPKVPDSSLRSNYSDDQGWYDLNELFLQNSHTLMYSYYMDGFF